MKWEFDLRIGCYCNGVEQIGAISKFVFEFSLPTFGCIRCELAKLAREVTTSGQITHVHLLNECK